MAKKKPAVKKLPLFATTRPAAFVPDPDDPKKAIQVGPQEVSTEGYEGSYRKIGDPESAPTYQLKVLDEDEAAGHYGRTHHAINQEFHWSGTEEQFRQQFDRA